MTSLTRSALAVALIVSFACRAQSSNTPSSVAAADRPQPSSLPPNPQPRAPAEPPALPPLITDAGGPKTDAADKLSPDQIRQVVMSHLEALRGCYDRAVAREYSLTGGITVHWNISADGHVEDASTISSSIPSPTLEACVLDVVRSWSFPPSSGPSNVSWPFKFGLGR